MGMFRKKPVGIEARQFTNFVTGHDIAVWCGGRAGRDGKPSDPDDIRLFIDIPTLEGTMTASVGDWIIKGVKGEFYPCKPDIFEATYEAVEE
jgi:hypothetical protein